MKYAQKKNLKHYYTITLLLLTFKSIKTFHNDVCGETIDDGFKKNKTVL